MIDDLVAAITTRWAGSALATQVGNRIYFEQAPDNAAFPYVLFFIVSDVPEYPSLHTMEELLLQFSIFSNSESAVEVADLLTHLRSLFDDCSLAIAGGNTLIYFIRGNLTTSVDEITTATGTQTVKHWAQEYEVCTTA